MRRSALSAAFFLLLCSQGFANGDLSFQHRSSHSPLTAATKETTTVYSGSLKANIERIAGQFGWHQVIWHSPDDYHWVGTVQVGGASVVDIFRQVLKDYPLQARFYQGNHIVVIVPRAL